MPKRLPIKVASIGEAPGNLLAKKTPAKDKPEAKAKRSPQGLPPWNCSKKKRLIPKATPLTAKISRFLGRCLYTIKDNRIIKTGEVYCRTIALAAEVNLIEDIYSTVVKKIQIDAYTVDFVTLKWNDFR